MYFGQSGMGLWLGRVKCDEVHGAWWMVLGSL